MESGVVRAERNLDRNGLCCIRDLAVQSKVALERLQVFDALRFCILVLQRNIVECSIVEYYVIKYNNVLYLLLQWHIRM